MANFTSEDIEYLRHGDRKIMARVFKPEGAGPFPCFIDLHGGAWNNGDLDDRTGLGEYLAERVLIEPSRQDLNQVGFDALVHKPGVRHRNHFSVDQLHLLALNSGQLQEFLDGHRRSGGAHI